ncbi:MAG: hypothetical protein HY548_08220, partial [Elusimicrobia bacterium]|nr:hypothetical protein [Elusimicrobiota bacterium]
MIAQSPWRFGALLTTPANDQVEKEFLAIAASLAAKTSHPAAREIERVARLSQLAHFPVIGFQDFQEKGFGGAVHLPGEGVPRAALIGSRAFLEECGLEVPAVLEAAALRWEEGKTVTLMGGWEGTVRGV